MHSSITAAYLARFRSVAAGSSAADSGDGLLPLTGAQRRFLIARRRDPQSRTDVVPLFFAYPRGTVDLPRLHRAALRLAASHPALHGSFATVRGTPVLRLGGPSVAVERAETGPDGTAEEALRRALLDWPADGPALRLLLAAAPDDEEELLAVALDHAACDEQSLGLVTAGLAVAYAEDGPAEPAADDGSAAYREAVELQLAAEDAAASAAAHAYWAARLGGLGGSGDAADAGPAARSTGMVTHRLPAATGAARGAVFPALLDAVGAAAHRLGEGDRALALGYPWGGRPPGAAPVVGCFLNTLVHPAPAGPAAGQADRTGLDELSAAWWDDLDHADTPFDDVVRAARSAGARWSGALDGLLTFEDLQRRPPLVLAGTAGRETHLAGRPLAAPLAVSASHGDDLLVRLAWDRDRYPDVAAEAAFEALLSTLRRHLGGPAA
ncbi:non-ribosomal peptide synthetase [Kitasatospora sp. CM 4170]|uniref:Condensation domain-containing protein n=1 Tax=Kitasatospora aburaviensis TaxID=67265 RepID=A0ABW1F237_9ACTN|nr:condensation domain-containing protein [Kitasatospora sp. CM 4170]WNM48992.1 non-ribosomal peptide synthetase [Kitasatospora sp. CM 4170]